MADGLLPGPTGKRMFAALRTRRPAAEWGTPPFQSPANLISCRMSEDLSSRERPDAGDDAPAEALRAAFRFALGGRKPADVERLRVTACEYVRDLRTRGVPPESAVVAIKDVLRRAITGQTPTHDSRREAEALVERVVTWCIAEYYRTEKGEEL